MTLTSDLVLRDYSRWESQIRCVNASSDGCVVYHLWVTVTLNLTSDLDFGIILSGACISLIIFEVEIPNLVHECILEWWISCHLTSDLVLRISIESGA